MKFDAEYQAALQGPLKRKSNIENDIMEKDCGISKGGDFKDEHNAELSEEEGVVAIQKWLEENSKGSGGMLAGANEGEVKVQEINMEIF